MKILITGGSGFIGSHFIDHLLRKGHEVTNLDVMKPVYGEKHRFVYGSIMNGSLINRLSKGKDLILHLAGILGTNETVLHPIITTKVNLLGTLNILEAAKKNSVKLLAVSKPNPWLNPYTITKIASESYCLMYQKEFSVDVRVVRWYNVYGPRQQVLKDYHKAVPTFILKALRNEEIPVYGTGKQTTDHIYVRDTIEATMAVVNAKGMISETVDIGSGEEISVNDLAKEIIKQTKSNSKLKYLPMRRGEDQHTRIKADLRALKRITGYEPKTTIEEGIKETIKFYKEFLDSKKTSSSKKRSTLKR